MTDRELKKLKRSDLLRLLVEQSRQMEAVRVEASDTESRLRAENQQLRQQLEERQLTCNEAGSLADAAVNLSGVMEAAQKAADQYLENIKIRTADQTSWLTELEAESKAKASRMVADAELECAEKRAATEKACTEQREATEKACTEQREATEKACAAEKAETERLCKNATNEAIDQINAYWNNLSSRLESFYDSHMGLQKLLQDGNMEPRLTVGVMNAVLMNGSRCAQ